MHSDPVQPRPPGCICGPGGAHPLCGADHTKLREHSLWARRALRGSPFEVRPSRRERVAAVIEHLLIVSGVLASDDDSARYSRVDDELDAIEAAMREYRSRHLAHPAVSGLDPEFDRLMEEVTA